jgi:hypothetical protein
LAGGAAAAGAGAAAGVAGAVPAGAGRAADGFPIRAIAISTSGPSRINSKVGEKSDPSTK